MQLTSGGGTVPRWSLGVVWLALASAASLCLQTPAAWADVDVVEGGATGVIVTGFLGSIPPTPTVALSADESSPPAALGPFAVSHAGVSLPGFSALFSTGALAVSTSAGDVAGDNHGGFAQARASAQDVNAGLGMATATAIVSTCRADGNGSTGTTVIEGGLLNGQPFANGTPAPNTVVDVPGIGTVTLNEQVRNDVPGSAHIIVNAVHARYAAGPGGVLPTGQTAEAIIGQVVCRATGPDVNVTTTTTTTAVPTTTATTATPLATAAPSTRPAADTLAESGSESYLVVGVLGLLAARAVRGLSRRGPRGAAHDPSREARRQGRVRG